MDQPTLARIAALEKRVAALEARLEPAPPPTGKSRRLPEGWAPDATLLAWCREKYPHVQETREREKFCDYWRSRGDSRRDWDAAYRNWIRKEDEFSQARPSARANGPASRTAAIDKANRERRDRVAAQLAALWKDPT
jgi:hypothetical protein